MSKDERAGILTKAKLDGFFLISSSWSVWNPLKSPSILFPLRVKKERTVRAAKGSRTLKNFEFVYVVRLFKICDNAVNIVFHSEEDHVDYNLLLATLNSSLENAINRLMASDTYAKKRQKVEYFGNSRKKTDFKISLEDYIRIGDILVFELNTAISSLSFNLGYVFLSVSAGQSCPIEYFKLHKWDLNEEYVVEVLYHVAFDNEMVGEYLIWSRDELTRLLGKPTQEYYPNAISRFGNYYFNTNSGLNDEMFAVPETKFYSYSHKHCHANKQPPFKLPSAFSLFLKVATSSFRKPTQAITKTVKDEIDRVRKELELLKRILVDFENLDTGSARVEAVCSFLGFEGHEVALQKCQEAIMGVNLISDKTLFRMKGHVLKQRCEAIFLPYINLVQYHLNKLVNSLNVPAEVSFFDIKIDEIMSCKAGESMICFMLYGISTSTTYTRGYSYNLCKDIGAIQNEFAREMVLFPLIGNGTLSVDQNERLEYAARHNYLPDMKIRGLELGINLSEIYELLAGVSNTDSRNALCKLILNAICKCVKLKYGNYKLGDEMSLKSTHVLIGNCKNHHVISTIQFANLFFYMQNSFFRCTKSLLFLRGLIKSQLQEHELTMLIQSMIYVMDEASMRQKKCLLFPVGEDPSMWAITTMGLSSADKNEISIWEFALFVTEKNCRYPRNLHVLQEALGELTRKERLNLNLDALLRTATDVRNFNLSNARQLFKNCIYK